MSASELPLLPPLRPVLNFDPVLLLRAQPVRVVFFDIDGVLTDGGLFISEAGETLKRFHSLDGHGIKLLQRAGITPAVVAMQGAASRAAREFGYTRMWSIHPAQIRPILEAFGPRRMTLKLLQK